jgi:HEAT repeat protein
MAETKGVSPDVFEGEKVVIEDVCDWTPRDSDQLRPPVLRDYRRITVFAAYGDTRIVDFTIVLVPLTKVTITRTNHSLFALRMDPDLSVKSGGTMVDAEGRRGEKATFGKVSPWMDCFGTRDGVTEGAAIFQHPANRWHESPWFTRDYGFFSPTPMQWLKKPLVLDEGDPVVLSYRVVVHPGNATEADIASLYAHFAQQRVSLPACYVEATVAAVIDQLPVVKAYEFGQSRKALSIVQRAVALSGGMPRGSGIGIRLEWALCEALAQDDTTADARRFLCRQLGLLGRQYVSSDPNDPGSPRQRQSEKALVALLQDGDVRVAETAALALRRLGTPDQLVDALPRRIGQARRTAIGALDDRGLKDEQFLSLLRDKAPLTRQLAAEEVGLSFLAEDSGALGKAWREAKGEEKRMLASALLKHLARYRGSPPREWPASLCREMAGTALTDAQRIALLSVSLVILPSDEARELYRQALRSEKRKIRRDALARVATLPDRGWVEDALVGFGQRPADEQVVLLGALAARYGVAYAPTARQALSSADASVVSAACSALAVIGGVDDVQPLVALAQGEHGVAALAALARIPDAGVTDAIGKALPMAGTAKRGLVEVLVKRHEPAGAKWLMAVVRDEDRQVRKEALKGLASLGNEAQRDAILQLLNEDLGSASTRTPYEDCAVALLRRFPGKQGASAPCLEGFARASGESKTSYLRMLGDLGEPAGLKALVAGTKDADDGVRDASVRALSNWPVAAAFAPLLAAARNSENLTQNVLALRGCRRMLALMVDAEPADLEKAYADCRKAAQREEERQLFAYDPKGVAVSKLKVAAKGTYRVHRAGLKKGASWATDRQYVFTEVPAGLVGVTYIETVMNHRSVSAQPDFMTFQVPQPVEVFVGFDNRCSKLPDWLQGWERTKQAIRATTDTCHLVLYRKSFPAGVVTIGGPKAPGVAAMYTVVVR